MATWQPLIVKAQLRLTSQRLGQLQEKKDSKGKITRRDIATLLHQGNIALARAKAQNLIFEDVAGDLLEVLEMHVGVILEHFAELDETTSPNPVIVEAASSIIYAAPHTESKDLQLVSDLLIRRLGLDFARSATANLDNYVSSRVITCLSAPPPSATKLNDYLLNIAHTYGVEWVPEPLRQDILMSLCEILDPAASPIVDLHQLRRLCSHGIPDEPAWLRPRVWKLFFGILPVLKGSWGSDMRKHRDSYYDLIHRLLEPLTYLSPPTTPLGPSDVLIIKFSEQLSRLPPSLFSYLEDESEYSDSNSPDDTDEGIRSPHTNNLDMRLQMLQEQVRAEPMHLTTPEIRLEADGPDVPSISLSTPTIQVSNVLTTLLPSKAYNTVHAHPKHVSALLRLLYLHSCINPGNYSPHIPALLVPLYSVMTHEIEPLDVGHVEADTFWLFEAIIGEFSELEDEEGGNFWMKKFSERLAWADSELSDHLHAKGLDPALPHYSYRWLAPILTQTLPLSSVLLVWDALFSCPGRTRDDNPKLDYLLDVCTGMLIRAREPIFRLGKPIRKQSPSLWGESETVVPPSLRLWELGDPFLEGLSFLQVYPLEAVGGIDRLLQTASDLGHEREQDANVSKRGTLSLGARLKDAMWKGLTNQGFSPESSPVEKDTAFTENSCIEPDGGYETETPRKDDSNGITSRLANSVWRGITNQSSMEVPPSPLSPLSPENSRSPSPFSSSRLPSPHANVDKNKQSSISLSSASSIWNYAEKLKDSDTAAALAKISSNWRAKAMSGSWGVKNNNTSTESVPVSLAPPSQANYTQTHSDILDEKIDRLIYEGRRISLPTVNRGNISSPPERPERPAHFRPPRDSMLPQPRKGAVISTPVSPALSPLPDNGFITTKTKSLQASLVSLRRQTQPSQPQHGPRSGPRPLLLSSTALMTASTSKHKSLRYVPGTSVPDSGQWADVVRTTGHQHKYSQSSVSSLSPTDALGQPLVSGSRSDLDSDSGSTSRVVYLNRRAVSPMAPVSRIAAMTGRTMSGSSIASSEGGLLTPIKPVEITSSRPSITVSPRTESPPPDTPVASLSYDTVRITDSELHRGSMVLSDLHGLPLGPPSQPKRLFRKKTPPPSPYHTDDTSDSSILSRTPSRNPRVRSKRYPTRPPNLRLRENSYTFPSEQKSSSNTLVVDWPDDLDATATPRAANFGAERLTQVSPISPRSPRRTRRASTDGMDGRLRKVSADGHEVRARKISNDSRSRMDGKEARRSRDSAAEEGDDEGYDDLLSAYESEENAIPSTFR